MAVIKGSVCEKAGPVDSLSGDLLGALNSALSILIAKRIDPRPVKEHFLKSTTLLHKVLLTKSLYITVLCGLLKLKGTYIYIVMNR